jgi:hypothetical protein
VKAITAVGTAFAVQEIKPFQRCRTWLNFVLTEKVFDFRS